jgi:alanine racemase
MLIALNHAGNASVLAVRRVLIAPCCAGLFSHLSTTMSTENRDRAWVDVSASALRENLQKIQDAVGGSVSMLPMVKADAYGLGVAEVVAALEPLDPWGYGVATVGEGIGLRRMGVEKPILLCSPIPPGSYEAAVEYGLSVSISGFAGLSSLETAAAAAGKPGRFHLEIDTGMGRAGFDWRQVEEWGSAVVPSVASSLIWEGCFTHFHSADGDDESPTETQWNRLLETVNGLPSKPSDLKVHACNSPGSLRRPDFAGDLVRPGIFLYGGVAGDALPPPSPVASLRARIVHIKDARPGDTSGYGATYSARGPERWATAAIGYGDGLPRLLSNRGEGVIRGRRARIVGRISMDVSVLNVTHFPDAELGDIVTFFGRSGGDEIALEEVAGHAGTINYEILTGLTRRLPRIWTDDGGY